MAFGLLALFATAQKNLTANDLWKLGRVSLSDVSPDGKTALVYVTNYDVGANNSDTKLVKVDVKTGEVTPMPTNIGGAKYMKDGQKIGGSHEGEYVLMDTDGMNMKRITNIKNASNWKAVELNDGRIMLMYTRPFQFKKSTADRYPELDQANAMIINDLMYRHWDHWNDEFVEHLNFAVYNGELVGEGKDIMPNVPFEVPNPPFGSSSEFDASADGQYIVYSCKMKTGVEFAKSTNTDLYLYDTEAGTTINMTDGMMGYDNHPQFSPDGAQLAWTSMPRDGYESDVNQLWVMNLADQKKTQTLSEEYVHDFNWINAHSIGYLVPKQATQQIGMIDFRKRGKSQERIITSGDYNYRGFIFSGDHIIAERQDMNHATEIFVVNGKNGAAKPLTHVNDGIYENIAISKIEKRWIKTVDDKDMLTWVIYPPNFDPNKKYPTLLYCQGGPQSAVSQFYSFRWNFQLMAANGYIIVAPNRRGLPGFGKDWNEAISKDWGGMAMKDYFSAIDALAKEPFVDEDRLGAVGASYGGYSVYMLAGIHENRFKTFVSHCGLFNLESWYASTEEMFFANWDIGGAYWDEPLPESYLRFSPHKYVKNWNTPIMVIHGGKDFRVPVNQGMEAFQAAKLRGIPARFLYFPEEGHWVLSPQNGIIWHTEYFKWLDRWLKK